MYKRDDKARFIALYGLILLVLGLVVMLIAAKITNNRILAKSEEVIQDSLKSIEENQKDILENLVYSNEIENGYKLISLDKNKKEQINSEILNNSLVKLIIQSKEYVDYNGYFKFNSGVFTDEEMMNCTLSIENAYNMELLTLKNKSNLIFSNKLNEEEISYYIDNNVVSVEKQLSNKDCILKIDKVFKNNENSSYNIFVDEIYPANPEEYEIYNASSKINYSKEEIVNKYKIHVDYVDNVYKFVSVELINVD